MFFNYDGFSLSVNYVSYQNPDPKQQIKNFRKQIEHLLGGQILSDQLQLLNKQVPTGTVFENLTLPSRKDFGSKKDFQFSNVEKYYHEDLASIHLALVKDKKSRNDKNENYKYLLISKDRYVQYGSRVQIQRALTDEGVVERFKKVSIPSGHIEILDRYNIHQVVSDIYNGSNRNTSQFRQNLSKDLEMYFQSEAEIELGKTIYSKIFPGDNWEIWNESSYEEDIFGDKEDDKKLKIARGIRGFARQNIRSVDFILNPFQPKVFTYPQHLRTLLNLKTEELAQYLNPQINENKVLEYLDTPYAKYKFSLK